MRCDPLSCSIPTMTAPLLRATYLFLRFCDAVMHIRRVCPILRGLGFAVLVAFTVACAAPLRVEQGVECDDWRSHASGWIVGQIHEDTHLIRSYDDPADRRAWTYDQAVGIISLLYTGYEREAEKVLGAMLMLLERSRRDHGMAALADAYAWDNESEIPDARIRATGPNAWMGLAFLHASQRLRDPQYLEAARSIATFVIENLQVRDGKAAAAFFGGTRPPFTSAVKWVIAEHNADMLALLRGLETLQAAPHSAGLAWGTIAGDLEDWMLRPVEEGGLWNALESRFNVGYQSVEPMVVTNFNELLDSQTWTLLALSASSLVTGQSVPSDRVGLAWLERNWKVSVDCNGVKRPGFSKRMFLPGLPDRRISSYWVEGMAGYALAKLLAPNGDAESRARAEAAVEDLACFQNSDGGLVYSVGETLDLGQYFEGGAARNESPLATFSNATNLFGGAHEVYGDAQPNRMCGGSGVRSGFYPVDEECQHSATDGSFHSPWKSFALVNDSTSASRCNCRGCELARGDGVPSCMPHQWASFSLWLAPETESDGRAAPVDISGFSELRFWARAATPDVRVKVSVTDRAGEHLWPAVGGLVVAHGGWKKVRVPLGEFQGVDLKNVQAVGISFGNTAGGKSLNKDKATLWVDDFSFFPAADPLPELKVYPDNWKWESVAATGWYVFAERGFNPFAVYLAERASPGPTP